MKVRRGFAAVLTGAGLGQFVLIAATPVLARLYTPADVAMLGVVIVLSSPIGMISTLRWDAAVPIPIDERDVSRLVVLGAGSVLLVSVGIGLVLLLLGDSIASRMGVARTPLLLTIPAIVAGVGLTQLLTQLAVRRGRFGATARSKAAQATGTAGAQVLLPHISVGGGAGLLGGYLVGLVVGIAALFPEMVRHAREFRVVWPSLNLVRRFVRFPLFLVPSTLVNAVGLHLPVLLVASAFAAQVTGQFAMAVRVVGIPVTVVGLAAAQVFLGTMAESLHASRRDSLSAFDRTSVHLLVLGAVVAATLVLAGPWLFALLLGEQWRQSGGIARALAPMVAAQLIASPLASTLTVLERPGLQFLLDVVRVVGISAAFSVMVRQDAGIEATAFAMSLVSVAFYLAYWATSRHQLVCHIRREPAT